MNLNLSKIFEDKASSVTAAAIGLGPSAALYAVGLLLTSAATPSLAFVSGGIVSGLAAKCLLGYLNTKDKGETPATPEDPAP